VGLNLSPGLHIFFQNADRWNYINVGLAGRLGIEFPLSSRWTVLINGYASFDNGNFGTNREMEAFDITYQYQLDLGVRYNKKAPNSYSYLKPEIN
jgi:hypothetical protein